MERNFREDILMRNDKGTGWVFSVVGQEHSLENEFEEVGSSQKWFGQSQPLLITIIVLVDRHPKLVCSPITPMWDFRIISSLPLLKEVKPNHKPKPLFGDKNDHFH